METWASALQVQRVSAICLTVAPSKSQHLVESGRRLAISPEAELLECAAGRRDNPGDEQSADPSAPECDRDIEVADATDSPVAAVRIRIEAANTNTAAAKNRREEGLARLRVAVRPTLSVHDQPAQQAEAGLLALCDEIGEPVGGQIVQAVDGDLCCYAHATRRR
jgi:hypothetical protein